MAHHTWMGCLKKKLRRTGGSIPLYPLEKHPADSLCPPAPFRSLSRCRLSLRQRFAHFPAHAVSSFCQGSKGSRAKGNGPGEAEADAEVAVAGPADAAPGRPAVVSVVDPAAAAYHAVGACFRAFRISFGTYFVVIATIPILTPLPYVAAHVMYA